MADRTGNEGFTLVEVICALAIAALSLVVLFRGLGSSQVAASYLEAQLGARLIAQSILADERQSTATIIGNREGDSGMYHWRLDMAKARVPEVGKLPPEYALYRLTVEVTWAPRGRLLLDTLKLGK